MIECPKCHELVTPTEDNKCPHCNTLLEAEGYEIKEDFIVGENK